MGILTFGRTSQFAISAETADGERVPSIVDCLSWSLIGLEAR